MSTTASRAARGGNVGHPIDPAVRREIERHFRPEDRQEAIDLLQPLDMPFSVPGDARGSA